MSLWEAPIWRDAGTWIVLGVSLLFIVVAVALHLVIRRVLRAPPPPPEGGNEPRTPNETP